MNENQEKLIEKLIADLRVSAENLVEFSRYGEEMLKNNFIPITDFIPVLRSIAIVIMAQTIALEADITSDDEIYNIITNVNNFVSGYYLAKVFCEGHVPNTEGEKTSND